MSTNEIKCLKNGTPDLKRRSVVVVVVASSTVFVICYHWAFVFIRVFVIISYCFLLYHHGKIQ